MRRLTLNPLSPTLNYLFRTLPLVLYLTADRQGKPQDVRVRESGGQDFDCIAMPRVRTWCFKPAPCDGEPIPAEINVAIYFRRNEDTKIPDFCNLQLATGLPSFKRVLSLQLLHRFAPDTLESLGLSQ
jgi:TonB family protein